MSTLWRGLETVGPNLTAVAASWQRHMGEDFERVRSSLISHTGREASSFPSRFICKCRLRVVKHAAHDIVGISDCETVGCKDVTLTAAEIELLELKVTKLARLLSQAFGWELRDAETGVEDVRQIGAFGPECRPILLGVPRSQQQCGSMVRELIGVLGGNFILLTPTNRFIDGNAQSALRKVNAGVFALEPVVRPGEGGTLKASRPADELFSELFQRRAVVPALVEPPRNVRRYVFEQAGDSWRVVFDGAPEFYIEDSLGARYLDYLFRRPNEPISAFDLEIAITPQKATAREKNSVQNKLDPEAARQYLQELTKLRARRDKAVDEANHAEADRLDDEIEAIETELKKTGDTSDSGERARGNVRKAVAAVRKKLLSGEKRQKAFGDHIQMFVSTGYECSYNQEQGRIWSK